MRSEYQVSLSSRCQDLPDSNVAIIMLENVQAVVKSLSYIFLWLNFSSAGLGRELKTSNSPIFLTSSQTNTDMQMHGRTRKTNNTILYIRVSEYMVYQISCYCSNCWTNTNSIDHCAVFVLKVNALVDLYRYTY